MGHRVLDLKRPHRDLDKGTGGQVGGPDFVEQDGLVFGWSESNVRYEQAWWLDPGCGDNELIRNIRRKYPLPGKTHADVIAAVLGEG